MIIIFQNWKNESDSHHVCHSTKPAKAGSRNEILVRINVIIFQKTGKMNLIPTTYVILLNPLKLEVGLRS